MANVPPVCCPGWSGLVGLPAALALFAVVFVVSIFLADFCYLGPANVLTGGNEDNRYLAYYLRCEGANPIQIDVDRLAAAVDKLDAYADELEVAGICTGVDGALGDIKRDIDALQAGVEEITEEVLSCRYFQPIVGDLFYDAICRRTVEGLYRVWVVLLAAAAATLVGVAVVPFATAAWYGENKETHDHYLRREFLMEIEKGDVFHVKPSFQEAVRTSFQAAVARAAATVRASGRRAKVLPAAPDDATTTTVAGVAYAAKRPGAATDSEGDQATTTVPHSTPIVALVATAVTTEPTTAASTRLVVEDVADEPPR